MLLKLFVAFLEIGLFSIGGGYAAIPVIDSVIVQKYGWFTIEEFTNLITISEMTPGPIFLNCSTFIGMQLAGVPGAIVSTIGAILPSCIIVTILAVLFAKFGKMAGIQEVLKQLRPAIIGLILASFLGIFISSIWGKNDISFESTNWVSIAIFVISFVALRIKKLKLNPIVILIFSGAVGAVAYFL